MANKFLNSNGNRLTKGLFIEWASSYEEPYAIYSMSREDKEVDGRTYPSLYKLYMRMGDVGEGHFVNAYLLDKQQWDMLREGILKDEVPKWRDELAQRKKSEMIEILERDALDSESKSSASSAKFLIEKVYGNPSVTKRPVGRPSTKTADKEPDGLGKETTAEDYLRVFDGFKR